MPSERQKRIRNFCIIAHIDHGKSTWRTVDRRTTPSRSEIWTMLLDTLELERAVHKAQAVRMLYTAADGEQYS